MVPASFSTENTSPIKDRCPFELLAGYENRSSREVSNLLHEVKRIQSEMMDLERKIRNLEIRPLVPENPNWLVFSELFSKYTVLKYRLEDAEHYARGDQIILENLTEPLKTQRQLEKQLSDFRKVFLKNPDTLNVFLRFEGKKRQDDYGFSLADWLLTGMKSFEGREKERESERALYNQGHQAGYGPSNLAAIERIFRDLNLSSKDSVLDVGSGLGRVVFYGAATTPAKFTGIEIVPERATKSKDSLRELGLKNADVIEGNLLAPENAHLFESANIFYFFNPLSRSDLNEVHKRLEVVARNKPIRIVTYGPSPLGFDSERWLKEVKNDGNYRYWIFESKPASNSSLWSIPK